ncbi:MAG: YiiD C-terminal domain-containing protein [Methylococcales bacterium]
MTREELELFLHREIPLTRAMEVSVVRADDTGITLSAPLSVNKNDKNTGFAGALATLTTLSGWALVSHIVERQDGNYNVVASESQIRYLKPVVTEIVAQCDMPEPELVDAFLKRLGSHGKSRLNLLARIECNEAAAVSFSGDYFALRK